MTDYCLPALQSFTKDFFASPVSFFSVACFSHSFAVCLAALLPVEGEAALALLGAVAVTGVLDVLGVVAAKAEPAMSKPLARMGNSLMSVSWPTLKNRGSRWP
jgi:hypothetical protein